MVIQSHQFNEDKLTYLDEGQGPAFVFIHGLAADRHMFFRQTDVFKDRYRLIIPNLIGNGDASELDVPYDQVIEKQSLAVIDLLDHLEIQEAIFTGTSYGGIICQYIAIHHSSRVRALILTDTFSEVSQETLLERLNLKVINAGQRLLYCRRPMAFLMKRFYRTDPDLADYMYDTMLNLRVKEAILQRQAINHIQFTKDLKQIKNPTLLLVGDRYQIMVDAMKVIHEKIQGSRLEIVPNAYDPSNIMNDEYWNQSVMEFLEGL